MATDSKAYGIVPDELHISIIATLGLGLFANTATPSLPRACGLELGLTLR
jgi:hypothetical protein